MSDEPRRRVPVSRHLTMMAFSLVSVAVLVEAGFRGPWCHWVLAGLVYLAANMAVREVLIIRYRPGRGSRTKGHRMNGHVHREAQGTMSTGVTRVVSACRDDSSLWVEIAGPNGGGAWELAPRLARELAGYLTRAADVADSHRTDSAADRSQTSAPDTQNPPTAGGSR